MANTPRSRKEKGNRLERKVAELYRKYDIDKTAKRMPTSGAMSHFKGDIFKQFDHAWKDECKNSERINFWAYWEQAAEQASIGQHPVLHLSGNHRPIITCMKIEDYMDLRATIKQLEETVYE